MNDANQKKNAVQRLSPVSHTPAPPLMQPELSLVEHHRLGEDRVFIIYTSFSVIRDTRSMTRHEG